VTLNIYIQKFLTKKNFKLIHLNSVGSTMNEIKKYIGNKKNICMIADQQKKGIGRRGNNWISPKGNFYISFLFKYNLSIEEHFLFSAITANSIVSFLKSHINEKINIKWPNDIMINNKKIAGIITEITELHDSKYIIVGTGINILSSPKIDDYSTCCLNDYLVNIKYDDMLFDMIKSYIDEYELIQKKQYKKILDKFKNKMTHLGSKVNILLPNGDIQNVLIKNLNYDGSLLVKKENKEEKIFSARIINDIN
jgi:BirA family transcriptional regulator, biotin operon repressor / biotin---[acetyl-CoA-carboxylase] ligase